jgi:hypothetical protein
MNELVKQLWLEALQSGKYTPATGTMRIPREEGYGHCCLGVLCDLYIQEVSPGTEFEDLFSDGMATATLPKEVSEWSGLHDRDQLNLLANYNDTHRRYPIQLIKEME